jgi:hypothetical protein
MELGKQQLKNTKLNKKLKKGAVKTHKRAYIDRKKLNRT